MADSTTFAFKYACVPSQNTASKIRSVALKAFRKEDSERTATIDFIKIEKIISDFITEEFGSQAADILGRRSHWNCEQNLHSWDFPGSWLFEEDLSASLELNEKKTHYFFSINGEYTLKIFNIEQEANQGNLESTGKLW